MCDQCIQHNAIIDALCRALGTAAAEREDTPVALAAVMLTEATHEERGRSTPDDMASMHTASGLVRSCTSEQRNHALLFLAMLKQIVTIAGNTLALTKHIYGDPDASDVAPGFEAMVRKIKAEADPAASNFASKRPANPRWN